MPVTCKTASPGRCATLAQLAADGAFGTAALAAPGTAAGGRAVAEAARGPLNGRGTAEGCIREKQKELGLLDDEIGRFGCFGDRDGSFW